MFSALHMERGGNRQDELKKKRQQVAQTFSAKSSFFRNTTPKKGFRQTHGNYEQKVKELSYSCAYRGPILLYTGETNLYKALFTSQLEDARSEKMRNISKTKLKKTKQKNKQQMFLALRIRKSPKVRLSDFWTFDKLAFRFFYDFFFILNFGFQISDFRTFGLLDFWTFGLLINGTSDFL